MFLAVALRRCNGWDSLRIRARIFRRSRPSTVVQYSLSRKVQIMCLGFLVRGGCAILSLIRLIFLVHVKMLSTPKYGVQWGMIDICWRL
jgi:hypothetical protein